MENTQNAIRDLLDWVSPSGFLDGLKAVFSGDALDELKEIAEDVKTVLGDYGRQAEARRDVLQIAMGAVDDAIVAFEKWARREFPKYLGEDVGNALATTVDFELTLGGAFWAKRSTRSTSGESPDAPRVSDGAAAPAQRHRWLRTRRPPIEHQPRTRQRRLTLPCSIQKVGLRSLSRSRTRQPQAAKSRTVRMHPLRNGSAMKQSNPFQHLATGFRLAPRRHPSSSPDSKRESTMSWNEVVDSRSDLPEKRAVPQSSAAQHIADPESGQRLTPTDGRLTDDSAETESLVERSHAPAPSDPEFQDRASDEPDRNADAMLETSLSESSESVAGSIRSVNPGGGDMNCVICVLTTEQMLDGAKVSAALDGPKPIAFWKVTSARTSHQLPARLTSNPP